MLLAIDIGNTNTVFALIANRGDAPIDHSWRVQTEHARTADEYAVLLRSFFSDLDETLACVTQVIVTSVVPEANREVRVFCRKYIGFEAVFVTREIARGFIGVAQDIDHPDDIGADRLVNAIAIKQYYQAPVIVVDFGTATTFDVVNTANEYAGGVIAPGVNLSMSALHSAASKLPKISVEKPNGAIGKNTVSAMRSGVYHGYQGLVSNIIMQIKTELIEATQNDIYVIATGGLAALFAKDNPHIDHVDNDLTLKGLCIIAQDMKRTIE